MNQIFFSTFLVNYTSSNDTSEVDNSFANAISNSEDGAVALEPIEPDSIEEGQFYDLINYVVSLHYKNNIAVRMAFELIFYSYFACSAIIAFFLDVGC